MAIRIGEGECAHPPLAICRATDQRHAALFQFSAHRIRVLDLDSELPDALRMSIGEAPEELAVFGGSLVVPA
jgi:hypothetical protein